MQYIKIFKKKNITLPIEQVLWIQAKINYTLVHTADGKKFLTARTLKAFEEQLPTFVRPNQSSLVNRSAIVALNTHTMLLKNGSQLAISRRKQAAVKQQMATWFTNLSYSMPLLQN